jgi:hypothetical protein
MADDPMYRWLFFDLFFPETKVRSSWTKAERAEMVSSGGYHSTRVLFCQI